MARGLLARLSLGVFRAMEHDAPDDFECYGGAVKVWSTGMAQTSGVNPSLYTNYTKKTKGGKKSGGKKGC